MNLRVNKVGVSTSASIEDATEEELHRHFDTNVFGNVFITREFMKQKETDGGTIVTITSIGIAFPQIQGSLYTAARCVFVGTTRVRAP